MSAYGDTLPYENEDKLLWDPSMLQNQDVESYLSKSQENANATSAVASLPLGQHVRDDEQVGVSQNYCRMRVAVFSYLFFKFNFRRFTSCISAATTSRKPCAAAG